MVDMLNAQDDLYHVNLQGLDKGEAVNSLTMIDASVVQNDMTGFQISGLASITGRHADFKSFDTYQCTDVTGRHFLHLYTAHTFECMQFLDF